MKMIKILLLSLLLSGSFGCIHEASNEQIAACVFVCSSINAEMAGGKYQDTGQGQITCVCARKFKINKDANNVIEIVKDPDPTPPTNPPSTSHGGI
jgi:hypothetical protein